MKSLLAPGIALVNLLKYPQKFGVIGFFIFIVILIFIFSNISRINQEINSVRTERVGLLFIEEYSKLLNELEQNRGVARGYLLGDVSLKKRIVQRSNEISYEISGIERLNIRYNNIFDIDGPLREIKREWNALSSQMFDLSPEENFNAHVRLVQYILALINQIGDNSNIMYSNGIDKYYLSRLIVKDIPIFTNEICIIGGLGSGVAAKKKLSPDEKKRINVQIGIVEKGLKRINTNTLRVIKNKKILREPINGFLLVLNNATKEFIDITRNRIIDAEQLKLDPEEFLGLSAGVLRSAFNFLELNIIIMDDLLIERIDDLEKKRLLVILIPLAILLALLYVFSCLAYSVIDSVKHLQQKANEISEGNLNVKTEIKTNDELKDLSDSMNEMVFSLNSLINRDKKLRDIIISVIESKTAEETINKIVINTGKIFDVERCVIVEYDADKNRFLPIKESAVYISSLEVINPAGMQVKQEETDVFTNIVFKENRVLVVNDSSILELPETAANLIEKVQSKSFMIAPLIYAGKPLGLISVAMTSGQRDFTKEEAKLLESIANQCAILLNQSKLVEKIIYLNRELESSLIMEKTVRKITSEATAVASHEEIDKYLINQLISILDIDKVLHFHVSGTSLNWYIRETKGELPESITGKSFVSLEPAREIIPGNDEIIAINNIETDVGNKQLKDILMGEEIYSLMSYPTSKKLEDHTKEEVIELTVIARKEPKEWTDEEKNLFKIIMDTISIVTLASLEKLELERTRKTFIATLAHDLKSPILSEQKALEYLLTPGVEIEEEQFRQCLDDIYVTNRNLLNLIDNLMAVYHYESGKTELNKTAEKMSEIIEESSQSVKYLADERKCNVLFNIQENLPSINVDRIEIRRVLVNLIANAIKHNPEGTSVIICAHGINGNIQVSVQDNGTGLSEELIPEVFQRYPLKKRKIGTGLGLYIAKQIIEAHGGEIWFKTAKGEGTTFYFTLPL